MRVVWAFLFSYCLGIPVFCAAQTRAPTPSQEHQARALFERGTRAYAAGQFQDAATAFESALLLTERPAIRFNLFRTYNELGDLQRAATQLRAYLPTETDARQRVRLEAELARIDAELLRMHATAVTHDPDVHDPEARDLVAHAAHRGAPAIVTPALSEPQTSRDYTWAIAGYSLAAVGAVATGIFGVMTHDRIDSLRDSCAPNCLLADVNGARGLGLATDIALGVGVLGAVLGTVSLALTLSRAPVSLALAPTTTGAQVSLEGRF